MRTLLSLQYLTNIESREEGGTPDIVGSIRCGLVFELKRTVGEAVIHAREQRLLKRALEVCATLYNVDLKHFTIGSGVAS